MKNMPLSSVALSEVNRRVGKRIGRKENYCFELGMTFEVWWNAHSAKSKNHVKANWKIIIRAENVGFEGIAYANCGLQIIKAFKERAASYGRQAS